MKPEIGLVFQGVQIALIFILMLWGFPVNANAGINEMQYAAAVVCLYQIGQVVILSLIHI